MSTTHNAVGRRKASVARVFLKKGKGAITINGKDYKEYFTTDHLRLKIEQPLQVTNIKGDYDFDVNVQGGGIKGQAEAVRLGVSRVLCEVDSAYRAPLKAAKFLVRDARVVERKKPGLRKARKKDQFSKR